MVLSALLFPSGRFSPSRFSLVSCWTTPSLSQPNSKVSGSNWKLPDRAAMCDATFDATAAATLDAAFLARLFPLLPVTSWERNEAFASPPVASSGHLDPEARAGAAATDSEDTVCVPLVDAMLEGIGAMAPVLLVSPASELVGAMLERIGAMAPVLLVNPASETDLKGYVSIAFLPAPLVFAPTLPHLERFDGWTLRYFQDVVQATAASLLHCKTGFENVDLFKTLVPGLRASSPVPVSKGMLKVEEDKRSNVYLVSPAGVLQVSSFGTLVLPLLALVQRTIWKERHQFFINCNDVRDAVVESEPVAKAAAALQGTCSSVHSGPWEAQHKVQPVQFFVKGKAGSSTSVVRGCLEEVLSQVVGTDGLDVYAMMNGKILDLCSTLKSCGITDGCTVHVHFRLRGGSREDVPGQWTCSHCFAPRCWPVRKRCYRCGEARDDVPVSAKGKGNGKADVAVGPLGRKPPQTASNVPPTTRRPQVVPPRGPPGAGVGSPPMSESPPSPPSEELVKALQLLQGVLTPEDFSKYEKKLVPPKQQERVKLRERELLEAVERQANYEKQEQKHLEMIEKHEHNLAQQKRMLESVRSQLAEVRDTVGALRALVSETKEPPINSIVPPLPPPREPPPPLETGGVLPTLGRAQDFLPLDSSYTQIDLDTDMEDETGLTQSKTNKKRVLMKLKGSSSSGRRETVKYEASSGKDLARALAKLSPGGMNEFVQSVPVNVAGFLMRSAAQSAPLRLWPTEIDSQDDESIRGGPAAIEACG